jgi:hypothetical protein
MPWWGWVLSVLGVFVVIFLAWACIVLWLLSKGDNP